MKEECQDVADQQAFAKGDPEHLVFAQTKALSDPLDVRLMPTQHAKGLTLLLQRLGCSGFLCHVQIISSTYLKGKPISSYQDGADTHRKKKPAPKTVAAKYFSGVRPYFQPVKHFASRSHNSDPNSTVTIVGARVFAWPKSVSVALLEVRTQNKTVCNRRKGLFLIQLDQVLISPWLPQAKSRNKP